MLKRASIARKNEHFWQQSNNSEKQLNFYKRFKKIEPQQIVFEATGKLERELVAVLAANGFAVVVVNLLQARDLAKGLGELTKTDAAKTRKDSLMFNLIYLIFPLKMRSMRLVFIAHSGY